ncbi:MAG: alpha-amylase family glycosyl hydrolase [Anaerolineales bacterium]
MCQHWNQKRQLIVVLALFISLLLAGLSSLPLAQGRAAALPPQAQAEESEILPATDPCTGSAVGDGNVVTAEVYHSNLEVAYRDPVGSVSMLISPTLRLRTCREDVSQVEVLVWETGEPLESPGKVLAAVAVPEGDHDFWTVEVPPPDTFIDQWYQFRVVDGATTGYYHPQSGNEGPGVWYTASSQQNPSWSLPRNDDGPPPPPDCEGTGTGDGDIRSTQLYHIDTDLTYRDPLGNIQMGEAATVTLRACAGDVETVTAWVWKTGAGATPSYTYTAAVASSDADYDYWQMVVPAPDVFTDQWYQFRVTDGTAAGYYHPQQGNTGPGAWSTGGPGTSWKLGTDSGPLPPVEDVPSWIQDAVIYQIFPDRFYNGNTTNDALIEGTEVYGDRARPGCDGYPHPRPGGYTDGCIHDLRGWNDPLLNPSWGLDYHGGDLQGITQKINEGYFADLGINTLYLNPIFEASSNHGYDTNDYYHVRAYFGGDAAFDELLTAAKANGLRVVLDAVFNHTGMDSAYIDWSKQTGGACASAASPFRPWFTPGDGGAVFQCADGWGWSGWYGYDTIPELVDDNDDVRDFFFRGGSPQIPAFAGGVSVSEYWIAKGIDGWRYDVAQDISQDWFREMRPYVKETYGSAEVLMLGEVTGGCASGGLYEAYTRGDQLDSVMNYCFRDWMAGFASGNDPAFFANSFDDFRDQYPPEIFYAMMNLISSHDSPRLYQMVGSDYANVKLAVLLQMMLPGAPSVYYGDEVGLPGGHDPDNRRTYPWGNAPDPTMYAHFKQVIGIRNEHSALRGGEYQRLLAANNVYAFARWDGEQTVIVALRNIDGNTGVTLPVDAYFDDGTSLTDVLNGGTYAVSGGNVQVTVGGKWGVVLVGPGQEVENQPPHVPSQPDPVHQATGISFDPILGWSGGDPDGDPVTYTVAFGTSALPPVVATGVTVPAYDPGLLAPATTYHWQITATDGLSETVGPLWTFATHSYRVHLPLVLRNPTSLRANRAR